MDTATTYLVRHPETDWNRQRRYQGRTARPLTTAGAVSIEALSRYFRDRAPGRIITSPAVHAMAAAQRIAATLDGADGPVVDDAWREIDHGAWEGLTHDQATTRFGAGAKRRFDDPLDYRGHGGETLRAARERIERAWGILSRQAGDTLLVTHATPIRLVLCSCLDVPATRQWRFRIDNASVTGISVAGGSATIDFINHRVEA